MQPDSPHSTPLPGQKWRARLQPVDAANEEFPEVTVTLEDFDARTDTWTVQQEGADASVALPAKCLIARVS